jgi:hypothetical protein
MSIYLARTYQNGLRRRRFIIDRSLTSLPRSKGPAHASRANAPYATSRTPGSATLDVRA